MTQNQMDSSRELARMASDTATAIVKLQKDVEQQCSAIVDQLSARLAKAQELLTQDLTKKPNEG